MRAKFLVVLEDLERKQSIVAAQDDLRQVIRMLQYMLMEETILMGLQDSVPFEKGHEIGQALAECFEIKHDPLAFQNLGMILAPLFGYDHLNTGRAFLMGLAKGMEDASPKLLKEAKEER